MTTLNLSGIRACVFDAYGTLFDVNSAAAQESAALGDRWQPLAELWRSKQLQYTWLRGLAVDRLGVRPEQICFVSANGWDAFSAKAFGLRVAWCNRFGQAPERIPALPDREIRTLSTLPEVVGA